MPHALVRDRIRATGAADGSCRAARPRGARRRPPRSGSASQESRRRWSGRPRGRARPRAPGRARACWTRSRTSAPRAAAQWWSCALLETSAGSSRPRPPGARPLDTSLRPRPHREPARRAPSRRFPPRFVACSLRSVGVATTKVVGRANQRRRRPTRAEGPGRHRCPAISRCAPDRSGGPAPRASRRAQRLRCDGAFRASRAGSTRSSSPSSRRGTGLHRSGGWSFPVR